jgi:hypothetical protein
MISSRKRSTASINAAARFAETMVRPGLTRL